jgi:signal peptidase I
MSGRTGSAARKRVARIVGILAVTGALVLLVSVAAASALGWWRIVPVRTGSMRPYAPQGSAVVVEPVAAASVRRGDVIVFNAPTEGRPAVVHRVFALDRGHGVPVIQTKGDANQAPDPWRFRIKGATVWRVRWALPYVGEALLALDRSEVRLGVLLGGATLLLALGLATIWGPGQAAPRYARIRWRAPEVPVRPFGIGLGTVSIGPDRRRLGEWLGAPALSVGNHAVKTAALGVTLALIGVPALGLFTGLGAASATYSSGVLNAPSPLSCRWTAASNIQLTWTNTSPGFATGYSYLRSNTSGTGYAQIGTTSGESSTTGNDTNPAPPTARYYVTQSTRATWTSPNSNQVVSTGCAGAINLFAGTGTAGSSGDGGAATAAQLNLPIGLAIDSGGSAYIADTSNGRIRKVTSGGTISTFAGGGGSSACSFSGAATSVFLFFPYGVAVDGSGNVYIADTSNNCVRKVTPGGTVSQVAGGGSNTACSFSGAATSVSLSSPQGVTVDSSGNIYIADSGHSCVRKVTPAGTVSQVAGTGTAGFNGDGGAATAAQVNAPIGLAIDSAGNIYIADTSNNRIRKVTSGGTISTIAGGGANTACSFSGAATSVSLNSPYEIAVDSSTNVFIADTNNNCVRKLAAGTISQVAGTGTASYSGDGGAAIAATLNGPTGLALKASGDLLVSDSNNNRVRRVVTP